MGAATLVALARRGVRALGIDRFSPPHAHGSSHGDTRITRLAIGEGPHYTPLAQRSHGLWRELERETGNALLAQVGGLFISSPARTAMLHVPAFFANTVAAARATLASRTRSLDAPASAVGSRCSRLPMTSTATSRAGRGLPPARTVHCRGARRGGQRGAIVFTNEPVTVLDLVPGGTTVATARGRYTADPRGPDCRCVVAVARRYRDRAPFQDLSAADDLARDRRRLRAVRAWCLPRLHLELQRRSQGIYGFPALDGPRGGVKIAAEQFATETTADAG